MTNKLSTKEILQHNLARSVPSMMKELIIFLHDVRSLHNTGAVFRNADAFGIKKLMLSGVTPIPPRAEITKTAIGAEEYVEWQQVDDPQETLQAMQQSYNIIGIEQTQNSHLLPDYQTPEQPVCLVFGNEVTGIDEKLLPLMDNFVEVPQYGHKHSLNVSVATGVVLHSFLEKYWEG